MTNCFGWLCSHRLYRNMMYMTNCTVPELSNPDIGLQNDLTKTQSFDITKVFDYDVQSMIYKIT